MVYAPLDELKSIQYSTMHAGNVAYGNSEGHSRQSTRSMVADILLYGELELEWYLID